MHQVWEYIIEFHLSFRVVGFLFERTGFYVNIHCVGGRVKYPSGITNLNENWRRFHVFNTICLLDMELILKLDFNEKYRKLFIISKMDSISRIFKSCNL